jgi:hypothetical protein
MLSATLLTLFQRNTLTFLLLACGTLALGQQSPADANGREYVRRSLAALNSGAAVNDVTLSGTAAWTLGSKHEDGTVVMKVKGASNGRLDLNLGKESRSEVRYESSGQPAGHWIDGDGAAHALPLHNSLIPPAWFLPSAFLATANREDSSVMWLGSEEHAGAANDHIRITRRLPAKDAATEELVRRLTTVDVYLDSTSHLPLMLSFNLHSATDAGLNIPAEVHFSDYRRVNGMLVPFHIQRFIQGTTNLEITLNDVTFNSGIPDSDFELR